jgi:hypothetical protein
MVDAPRWPRAREPPFRQVKPTSSRVAVCCVRVLAQVTTFPTGCRVRAGPRRRSKGCANSAGQVLSWVRLGGPLSCRAASRVTALLTRDVAPSGDRHALSPHGRRHRWLASLGDSGRSPALFGYTTSRPSRRQSHRTRPRYPGSRDTRVHRPRLVRQRHRSPTGTASALHRSAPAHPTAGEPRVLGSAGQRVG